MVDHCSVRVTARGAFLAAKIDAMINHAQLAAENLTHAPQLALVKQG
jgi:hypothetical protein